MFKAKSNFKIMKNSSEIEISIPSEQVKGESQGQSLLNEVEFREHDLANLQNPLKKFEIKE
jgi:hypothetical protein